MDFVRLAFGISDCLCNRRAVIDESFEFDNLWFQVQIDRVSAFGRVHISSLLRINPTLTGIRHSSL
ncbi:hypothetical protein OAG85_03530, partial [Verrucomicrobiales bacterium]|nr:hypothetical protein [Verrucomicrobiales bacterium]